MSKLWFDVAHLLAGGMLVLSFALLYQDRIAAAGELGKEKNLASG